MTKRPKAVIESRNGEKLSPITIAKNVLTDDGQNLHDILSDRKEDMMTPTIENSSSMFKVGQGDNVDYSSNVVNGAYESMVLKGKSMVNCIQESSNKDVVLPYKFEDGQYVTINDTKESGALGVELKGQTLVNIHKSATYTLSRQNSGWYDNYVTKANEVSLTITDTSETGWKYLNLGKLNLNFLKPNTKYLVVFSETKNLSTVQFMNGDGTKKISNTATVTNNRAILTTNSTLDLSNQVLYTLFHMKLGEVVAKNAMIIEYQEGMENWDISYFEGMTSCKMPILKSVNQMFDYSLATKPSGSGTISFTNNGRSLKANFEVARDCTNVTNITLPAGTYEISYEIRGAVTLPEGGSLSSSRAGLSMFKSSQEWYNASESLHVSFSSIKPTKYTKAKKTIAFNESVTIAVVYHGWNNNPVGWCEIKDIRIVPQGKTSILSLPEEIVLRSLPNGVCDTFNTRTGEYVQCIGEHICKGDSSEVWGRSSNSDSKTLTSHFNLTSVPNPKSISGHCNALPYTDRPLVEVETESYKISGQIWLNVLKTKLETDNTNGLKKYLKTLYEQGNPITIQYELATPIVTKINLPSTLKSWNTTTHIYSEIPENTLYPILSHANPTYPVILKPSTKYSIVANSYSNNHTNSAINFNLGGATASTTVGNRVTTITTPSTLSNELLTMSGRGNKLNNVMVIEGDVVGDESYFEGMCDCKSPIVSNVGKNLFTTRDSNIETNPNHKLDVLGENHIEITATTNDTGWLYTTYKVKGLVPNTTYILSGDVLEGTNNSSGSKGVMLIHDFNTTTSSESVDSSNRAIRYTTPKDVTKVRVLFYSSRNQTPNKIGDTYSFKNIQLEKAQDITTYEPYKSNTTTFEQKDGKMIVLRSLPNGVCDTLNVETGEYIQNVVDIVLDGTENWILNNWGTDDNFCSFEISSLNNTKIQNVYKKNSYIDFYCDTFKVLTNCNWNYMSEKHIRQWSDGNRTTISVIIPKSELKTYNVTGFIEYLTKNNIRINIRANNPIVSTVDIQGFPYAYKNGYAQLSSGSIEQSLTPKVEYSVVTNRNGQIRSNQKMVERHQKQLDRLQAMILANLVNTQYEQTLTNLKYDLKNVREEVK